MMKLHPDRHVNDADKVEKAAEATHVTRAYDVLNNPLSRALHLLELKGAAIDESDAVRLFNVFMIQIRFQFFTLTYSRKSL
eukprot:scaffold248391_cov70-Cyclotella_meneghiniana.AAC.3